MDEPIFGPGTSHGVIPDPVVLSYYGLFCAFGSFFYNRKCAIHRWRASALTLALTVIFLPGLIVQYVVPGVVGQAASAALQTIYAWLMCFGMMGFGMMGLFGWIAGRE